MMPAPIRAAVVDDHPLFRAGVAKLLARTPGLELVADGGTASDAIEIAHRFQPDVLLLDLILPGGGPEAASTIARECPTVRTVILTASDRDEDVATMLKAGVRGYLLKGSSPHEIVRAVQEIFGGELYVTPSLAARLLTQINRPPPPQPSERPAARSASCTEDDLSEREELILAQVLKGFTNKEIARGLDLREKTIKNYMTNIMQKLNVRNRLEAALKAQAMQASWPGRVPGSRQPARR